MAVIRHRATGQAAGIDDHLVEGPVRPGEIIVVGPNGQLDVSQRTVDEIVDEAAGISGLDTQVIFNDDGDYAGDAGLLYDKTTGDLTVGNDVSLGNDLTVGAAATVGTTLGAGDTTLTGLSVTGIDGADGVATDEAGSPGDSVDVTAGDGGDGTLGDADGGDGGDIVLTPGAKGVKAGGGTDGRIGLIILNNVPNADPGVAGALYTTAGALMVSAG